jgi:hypothetical protein
MIGKGTEGSRRTDANNDEEGRNTRETAKDHGDDESEEISGAQEMAMHELWELIWFVVGAGAAIPLTYLWTLHSRRLNAIEERLRAEKAESYQRGKDAALEGLTFERFESTSRRGIIWKSTSRVVSERVMLNGIPITPFYEYAIQIDETLDPKELGHVADAVRVSMGLPSLAEFGVKALPEKVAKKLS